MALRLSPEDEAEYQHLCRANELIKQAAISAGNTLGARRARQANTALYQRFEKRQLPPPPPTKYEREGNMPLEERIDRIEQHLKLGRYAEDFYD